PYHSPSYASIPTHTTTPSSQIYTLSLHDALPISLDHRRMDHRRTEKRVIEQRNVDSVDEVTDVRGRRAAHEELRQARHDRNDPRSEEHTSELQSLTNLVCRLLLEKKKTI